MSSTLQITPPLVAGMNRYGRAIFAGRPLVVGTTVFQIAGRVVDTPTQYTVQVGRQAHVVPDAQLWGLLNHACEPNCQVDFQTWAVVVTRAIEPGEEVTFNYLTTEWAMAAPFICRCGAASCFGIIRGFQTLSAAQRQRLRPHCAPHLWRLPGV